MSRSRHLLPALLGAAGLVDEPPARRGHWRAFLETRGLVGGHAAPHAHVTVSAEDGTRLVGTWLPGPHVAAPAVVLAHGFAAHRRKPAYARLADRLAAHAHVLALDLRGHGHSGGHTTLGDREALDVAGGVAWLRAHGHDHVVVVGASMGATSVLHALARGTRAEAAVVVSAPAELEEQPSTAAMQRLRRLWESRPARVGMRYGIGVRVVPPSRWRHPGHPRDFATGLDVPLLVVHGADDAYFPVADAEALVAAAPDGRLWLEPAGFGHAEDGFTPDFADRLGRAVAAVVDTGRFPDRDEALA
jgi:pimeloyl-ACP methyl ester carboxylesterase